MVHDSRVANLKVEKSRIYLLTRGLFMLMVIQVNLFPRLYGKENKSLFGVVAVRQHNTHDADTDPRALLESINKMQTPSSSQMREVHA